MSEKYFKVIVTKEFVVPAKSEKEARQIYKFSSVWMEQDTNAYQLTENDLEKYGINKS